MTIATLFCHVWLSLTATLKRVVMNRRGFVKATALLAACAALTGGPPGFSSTANAFSRQKESGNQPQKEDHQMAGRPKCKITVLRREYYQDLADKYLADPNVGKCQLFHDGQEFLVDGEGFFKMLNGGFCSEA